MNTAEQGTYRHSAHAHVPGDVLFAYVSLVRNLPRYFPAITLAEPLDEQRVRVEAEVHGRPVAATAWLEVDEEAWSMRWGAPGPNDYHGELHVTGAGSGDCEVSVVVHTTRAGGPEVARGLAETVSTLAQLAGSDADAADPATATDPEHTHRR